jgi:enolase
MKIVRVQGHEIYDSRGWPTLLTEVWLEDGSVFTGYAPTGISCSRYEAREVRDGGTRLWGKGVRKAIEIINEIVAPALIGKEANGPELDLHLIEIDNTPDKSNLGSNTLVSTSMALYRAHAHSEDVELYELFAYLMGSDSVTLPCPLFNVINGGQHADNNLAIQEFMIAPIGAPNLREAVETCVTVSHELKNVLRRHGLQFGIGDEGGYTAPFTDARQVLDLLLESLEKVTLENAGLCAIALDAAATQFYDPSQKKYIFQNQQLSAQELLRYYEELVDSYPIFSIEDAFAEDDWDGWEMLYASLGERLQIVGDDIFATNQERISYALQDSIATAVIIKPNQVGTITETLQVINECKKNQLGVIISHRSGETADAFIADLAVGTSAGQIKAGGACRSERLAKYNRMMYIEESLLATSTKF